MPLSMKWLGVTIVLGLLAAAAASTELYWPLFFTECVGVIFSSVFFIKERRERKRASKS